MRVSLSYLLILSFVLIGCKDKVVYTYSYRKAAGAFEKISFNMLLETPDKYHGKKIELTGFYKQGFEESGLYPSNLKNPKRAIWINFHKDLPLINNQTGVNLYDSYKEFEKISNHRIRVKGKFDMNSNGHENQYFGELYYVVSIEVLN